MAKAKTYFDRNGKEIKAGMTVYFGTENWGNCVPVVLHQGQLCFDCSPGYEPLDNIDLSNGIIEYDPEEDS